VSFFMEGLKMKLNSKERVSEEDEQATEVRIITVAVCINCMYLVLCIVQVFPVHAVFLSELKMLSISMLGLNNLSIYVPVTLVYFYKQLCILSTMLCVCMHTFVSVCLSVCVCLSVGVCVHVNILSLQEKMIAVVVGLLRQKKVHFMYAAREELTVFIKSFMKEVCNSPTQPDYRHF